MSVGKRREKYFYDIQFYQWSSFISVQCIWEPYGFLLAIPINSFLFTKPCHSHDYLFKTFAILHTVSSVQLNSCGFMLANRHITLGVSTWCIAFVIERKDCSFFCTLFDAITSFEDAYTIQRHRINGILQMWNSIGRRFFFLLHRVHSIFNAFQCKQHFNKMFTK